MIIFKSIFAHYFILRIDNYCVTFKSSLQAHNYAFTSFKNTTNLKELSTLKIKVHNQLRLNATLRKRISRLKQQFDSSEQQSNLDPFDLIFELPSILASTGFNGILVDSISTAINKNLVATSPQGYRYDEK